MEPTVRSNAVETLRTLPGDDARQLMWRFADRYDLQMLIQSVRGVARGPVARLVAQGGRSTHEWTAEKNALLPEFDRAGITTASLDPESGGVVAGPKNLALALVAFELAWVDAGAATGALAQHLALAPIHERGTDGQRQYVPRPARLGRTAGRRCAARSASPNRFLTSASRRDCSAARCASPSGVRARSRSSRSRSAAGSSPTWRLPTSWWRRSTAATPASAPAAWSSSRRRTRGCSTAGRRRASWCTSSRRPATRSSTSACRPAESWADTRSGMA